MNTGVRWLAERVPAALAEAGKALPIAERALGSLDALGGSGGQVGLGGLGGSQGRLGAVVVATPADAAAGFASATQAWRQHMRELQGGHQVLAWAGWLEAVASRHVAAGVHMLADGLAAQVLGEAKSFDSDGVWPVFAGEASQWPLWEGHEGRGLLHGSLDLLPMRESASQLVLPARTRRAEAVWVLVDLRHPAISVGEATVAGWALHTLSLDGVPAQLLRVGQTPAVQGLELLADIGAMALLCGVGIQACEWAARVARQGAAGAAAAGLANVANGANGANGAQAPSLWPQVQALCARRDVVLAEFTMAVIDAMQAQAGATTVNGSSPAWCTDGVRRRAQLLRLGEDVQALSQAAALLDQARGPLQAGPGTEILWAARLLRGLTGGPSWRRHHLLG